MKLAAVAQRGSKKDFVDIFALGQHFALAEMLGFYRAKYGVKDIGHVLVALAYFDDADRERMPTLLRRWDWSTMKSTIGRWVSDVTQARYGLEGSPRGESEGRDYGRFSSRTQMLRKRIGLPWSWSLIGSVSGCAV